MIEEMETGDESHSDKGSGGCYFETGLGLGDIEPNEWLEETVWYGMRMWHVIFLSIGTVLSFIILLCCCFKFRIPRTKQEIEGDYIRRKIMRKFRKRLKAIQNQELDEMDLKKALDKIRTELKSDTESLQQSDVLSGTTLSSAAIGHPAAGSTYRRASQIHIDISLEDLRIQSLGLGARIALAFSRFFHKSKKPPQEENGAEAGSPEGGDKPTTALLPKQSTDKKEDTISSGTKKGKKSGQSSTTPEDTKKSQDSKSKGKNEEDKAPASTTTKVTVEKETKKKAKENNKGNKEKGTNETMSTKESSSSKPPPPSSSFNKERDKSNKSSSAEKTKGGESQKSSGGAGSTKPPSSTSTPAADTKSKK